MTAYLLMAVLLVACVAWITRPEWQRALHGRLRRKAANVAVYRSSLAEIDADLAAGVTDAGAAEQLRQELGLHLLEDVAAASDATEPPAAPRHRLRALVLTLLLGLFAGGLYVAQGSWRTQQIIELSQRDPQAGQALAIDAMVQRLATRLQQQPDDVEGWAMLGRSYFMLQRYADAARAYAEANRRSAEPQAELLVGEGEALALARDRDLQGRPRELFEQALQRDPASPRALWYAGLAAAQANDLRGARERWLRLREQELPPELAGALESRLQELAQLLHEPLPARASAPPARASAPPAAAGAMALRLRISLAPELAGKPRPGSTLFVFAKAAEGPPMPLAVQRLDAGALPREVVLDDSMAMMPQLKLSQFERWIVSARITASGSVKAEAGDWEGSRPVSRVESAQPIALVIDRVVP